MMTQSTLLDDRFVLGERLGAGGMGEVFAAFDRREARVVAVKRLRPGAGQDPEVVRRFAREGAILRSAAHPNIVNVLAVVEQPTPHIVMEYVAGGSLQERLEREPRLPLEIVLALALDLSDALARAHRLGIVHRDVKPANVLLAEDGTPRLSDFGVAFIAGADPLTHPGAVVGTLPYLAPEGWDGDLPGVRADIWSLGVVLYECLAGRRPFAAEHVGMLHAAVALHEPPSLSALRPEVPAPLIQAIRRMLAKRPDDRMASVRELGLVVERLLRPMAVTDAGSGEPRVAAGVGVPPRPGTPLIGRGRELRDLEALLMDPSVQLLSLTGPGGSGKTRLALAAAEAVRDRFRDGMVWVDLTPIADSALVLPAIARAMDVEEELQRPLLEILAERLGSMQRLLVLDNFEQVLDAAPQVAALLAAAAGVTVLVTSRFRLGLTAERDYPVPALPQEDADALFVARARALDPTFNLDKGSAAAVAEICRRLDRLPLAIELAAARSRVLPPGILLTQLDHPLALLTGGSSDGAPHRRTLRRTIEWSVNLLEDRDRDLFTRLAVFVGGWTLEDAATVVTDAGMEADIPRLVDGLQSLVEKSLVTLVPAANEVRYRMLETLREFAIEMLKESHLAPDLARRHASHFARVAVVWDEEVSGANQAEALARFTFAQGNLRAALGWHQTHEPARLPELAAALGQFWYLGGHWHEALAWYQRALDAAPDASRDTRARILDLRGRLEMFLGDEPSSLAHHREAWELAGDSGPPKLRSRVAEGLGEVLLKVGEGERATTLLETAVAIARGTGDPGTLSETLTTLATARVGAGAFPEAQQMLGEALLLGRKQGNRYTLARIHYYLGGLALLVEDPVRSRGYCEAGRAIAADSGDEAWACHLDEMLGRALVAEGRWTEAQALFDRSVHTFHAVGSRSCLPHGFEAAARLKLARALTTGGAHGELAGAARLLGAADALCRELSIAMLPVERALLAQTATRLRGAMGEEAYQEEWEAGRLISEAAAVAEVAACCREG